MRWVEVSELAEILDSELSDGEIVAVDRGEKKSSVVMSMATYLDLLQKSKTESLQSKSIILDTPKNAAALAEEVSVMAESIFCDKPSEKAKKKKRT